MNARRRINRRTRQGRPGATTRPARLLAVTAATGAAVLVLASCAAGPNDVAKVGTSELAGFWLGLWQGLISPITFLVSLFNDHVNIYEVHNNGNWYNFGFMLGVSIAFGGLGGSGHAASRGARKAA